MTYVCESDCDDDCESACHEAHFVEWKRNHDPDECIRRQGMAFVLNQEKAEEIIHRVLASPSPNRIRRALAEAWEDGFNAAELDIMEHEKDRFQSDCVYVNPFLKEVKGEQTP